MPPPRNSRKRSAATLDVVAGPSKYARNTNKSSALQPVVIDTETRPTSPRLALIAASQGADFESQLRNSRLEAAIVAPVDASEAATAATLGSDNKDECFYECFADTFEGID
ncbi:hypothetical protein EJ02DRAFT_362612, partial [Clathrospora elynae]